MALTGSPFNCTFETASSFASKIYIIIYIISHNKTQLYHMNPQIDQPPAEARRHGSCWLQTESQLNVRCAEQPRGVRQRSEEVWLIKRFRYNYKQEFCMKRCNWFALCRYGVPQTSYFQPSDLYEGRKGQMLAVVNCLNALGCVVIHTISLFWRWCIETGNHVRKLTNKILSGKRARIYTKLCRTKSTESRLVQKWVLRMILMLTSLPSHVTTMHQNSKHTHTGKRTIFVDLWEIRFLRNMFMFFFRCSMCLPQSILLSDFMCYTALLDRFSMFMCNPYLLSANNNFSFTLTQAVHVQ